MTSWLRIDELDQFLAIVDELPASAVRLDTGQRVTDVAKWARACGFYDTATDIEQLKADVQDPDARAALVAAVAADIASRSNRATIIDRLKLLTDLAREFNWDWIDGFCHPSVATISYVAGQSPNAGATWESLTAAEKLDRLRLGVSLAMVEGIAFSLAFGVVIAAVKAAVEADTDIELPAGV